LASGELVNELISQPKGNRVYIEGSLFVKGGAVLHWKDVEKWSDVTPEKLKVIEYVYPRPDLILFGCGDCVYQPSFEILKYFDELNIKWDVFDSGEACGTYNILSDENREVALFILPYGEKANLTESDKDLIEQQKQQNRPSQILRRKIERSIQDKLKNQKT